MGLMGHQIEGAWDTRYARHLDPGASVGNVADDAIHAHPSAFEYHLRRNADVPAWGEPSFEPQIHFSTP